MKKLSLISLLLLACVSTQAQHLFTYVEETIFTDDTWGIYVEISDDIRITNMDYMYQAGTYKIEWFAPNESIPTNYLTVKFDKKEEIDELRTIYTWTVIKKSDNLSDLQVSVLTFDKLSLMSKGTPGLLTVVMQNTEGGATAVRYFIND